MRIPFWCQVGQLNPWAIIKFMLGWLPVLSSHEMACDSFVGSSARNLGLLSSLTSFILTCIGQITCSLLLGHGLLDVSQRSLFYLRLGCHRQGLLKLFSCCLKCLLALVIPNKVNSFPVVHDNVCMFSQHLMDK